MCNASQRSDTTELLIVLSEAERQSLRAGLIEDHTVVTQMLVDIDVEEAKAEQESDHRQLSVRLPSRLHVYTIDLIFQSQGFRHSSRSTSRTRRSHSARTS